METSGVSAPSFTSLQMHDERPEETYAAPSSSKRRKSDVWNDFNKVTKDGPEGKKVKAVCNHCKRELDGSSQKGTTHLKNHLSRCPAKKDGETRTKMTSTRLETASVGGDFVFDDKWSRLDVARMIIMHGYPLDMVKHEFFQIFVKNLQPGFKLWPEDALKADILHVYKTEKEKLYKYLGTLSCHFNLIIQFWICHRKKNVYCCFELQFLEDGLILKKKILALKKVDRYDDIAAGTLFGRVTSLLQEWNIDKKLCSITLRSSHPNDKMVQKLETWLCKRACQLPLCGNFFHIHCTTDILNLLFQDGWNEVGGILGKIRKAARYINEEQLHLELNLDQILEQHYFQGKYSVSLRWDSAIHVLKKALNLKNLFSLLETKDRDFVAPSMDEWNAAAVVYEFLKLLYDDSCHLLGCKCLTANVYFSYICGIHFKLLELLKSKDQNICIMATKMKIQFDKYFDKCRTVLAIASILDPRKKGKYVTFAFEKCYGTIGQTHLAAIMNALNNIFDYYEKELGKQALSSSVATSNGNSFTSYRDVSNYDELNSSWREETCYGNKVVSRKELDRYLVEPCIDRNDEFDILDWWRTNSQEFPTLRKMALDILGISMSTDLDFGIGDMTKVVDPAFNGLQSDIIEALICGKDWLDMSIKKAPNKEEEHFSSYTSNGELTDHDHTSMVMGGPSLSMNWERKLDPFGTNMDMLGIGHQNVTHPHRTPITPRSPRFQVPVSQEPLSQPLPDVLTMTNINPTVTVPQETNFDIGIRHQHHPQSHCTPITPCISTSQVPVLQEPLSQPPTWMFATAYNNSIVTVPQETEPNPDIGIGHQHGPQPHYTPTTLRSPTSQVPFPQEPNSQPLADCMLRMTNVIPTVTPVTVPQETEPNPDIGIGHQNDPHPHYTASTPRSPTSQVPVTHEYLSSPNWELTLANNNLPESSSSGNWASNVWGNEE